MAGSLRLSGNQFHIAGPATEKLMVIDGVTLFYLKIDDLFSHRLAVYRHHLHPFQLSK